MTPELTKHEKRPAERGGERAGRPPKLRNLEAWAKAAPIRLAGYEDDLAEPHILPGID
ncbi:MULTISPECIES: hypothetical protein [Streptomyces]|uniref:Uncharacterized protein n=1 Tax=Streptomyces huasconensis TaxID=1854574 RepID=A0ABV3LYX2_9ACTN|nr:MULTISPECIES: hypothetical protein [Streptomyces]UFQ19524.1 hypothetical protein J2N69_33695 [Streptomyces huasconensis]WCL89143.1 hypothetical protein PPN52_33645 [Streptomyces sp. JCM 35825]WPO69618.1 hypothetical protein R9806_02700 [Streptomyces sp. KN37]